jgi:hypothetical protein
MRWIPLLLLAACKVKDPPPVTSTWREDFDRGDIGLDYFKTGPGYAISDGQLSAHGAHNHPLWLRKKLPRDVQIDLDCWSTEPRGDLKVEVFGDGRSFDPDGGAYMATGYELIFGGWFNTKSEIARMDEHAKDIPMRVAPQVVPNQHYHWRIMRRARTVTWFIDDMTKPFLELVDKAPLEGAGHEYFGFNNWETDTWFDNLVITPL